ncbi:MAG: cysteine desulfurase [Deltaproteobacteria bacterium]|nr:cysteine desulfurase [Deltaproteobacteria bacterium]
MTVNAPLFPALGAQRDAAAPFTYLDSATTALTPQVVIDAVTQTLAQGGSAGRSVHALGLKATEHYEQARTTVARHLGGEAAELVFVRSATEGLNLLAEGWARPRVGPGDEICVTVAEHHSNLLPWRRVCEQRGARLVVAPCDDHGDLELSALRHRLTRRTKLLAVTHVSNVTGAQTSIPEVARALAASPAAGAPLVVDGAQAVAHHAIDVADLGCDFYVLSGHKAHGPAGIGAVWAKPERWRQTQPLLVGGGMVDHVSAERIDYAEGPARLEAGTPNVAGAVGLAAALRFLAEHRDPSREHGLVCAAAQALGALPGIRLLGAPRRRIGAISFVVDGIHAHDVGSVLDSHGVAVRAGHHCAQPLLARFGVGAAVRASFGLHNDQADVDRLVTALAQVRRTMGRLRSCG